MTKWINCLKEYNRNQRVWCVPKKGSRSYDKIMKCVKGDKNAFDKKKKFKIVEKFEDEEPRDIQDNPDLVVQMKRATINDVPQDVMNNIMGQYLDVKDKAKLASVGVKVKMTDKEAKKAKKKANKAEIKKIESLLNEEAIGDIKFQADEYHMLRYYDHNGAFTFNFRKSTEKKIIKALKLYDDFIKKNKYPLFTKLFLYYANKYGDDLPYYVSDVYVREEEGAWAQGWVFQNDDLKINLKNFNNFAEEIETRINDKLNPEQKKISIEKNKKSYLKIISYLKKTYQLLRNNNKNTKYYAHAILYDFKMEDYNDLELIPLPNNTFYIYNTKTEKKYETDEQIYSLIKLIYEPKQHQQRIVSKYQDKYDDVKDEYS